MLIVHNHKRLTEPLDEPLTEPLTEPRIHANKHELI